MKLNSEIRSSIELLLADKEMSAGDLGVLVGTTESTINRWRRGANVNILSRNWVKLEPLIRKYRLSYNSLDERITVEDVIEAMAEALHRIMDKRKEALNNEEEVGVIYE